MNTTMANSDSASNARLETEENLVRSLPVGFRFRPNDEEIVVHYLIPKVMNSDFGAVAIGQADLNKCEPWDLPKIASVGEKEERYYFNLRDKKYPNGQRTNRATHAGYWKATGKDKEIYIGHRGRRELMGMKKTLVFYIGRAPKGAKTNWIMHEFRIHHQISFTPKNDGWVVSKIFYKNAADNSREIPKMSQSVEQSSFLPIRGSDDHSFSTDVFINYDNLESLPPAPVTPQIEFKPELVAPMPDTPANMWGPNISAFFDPNDEDLVSYAQDSSYYYPSFSDLVSLPAPEPEPFAFDQPMLGNNVAGTYAAENSFNGTVNHNNYMNLEMATTSGQEPSELQILPATGRLGSMPDLSGMWDY